MCKDDVSSGNTCYSISQKGRHYTPTQSRARSAEGVWLHGLLLEKANLIGEAPGQRPGDVFFPNMYNGEDCAADIAVTCPLRDVYARLADGMSPADTMQRSRSTPSMTSASWGLGSPFGQLSLRHWWSVNRGHDTLQDCHWACCQSKSILARIPKCDEELTGDPDANCF